MRRRLAAIVLCAGVALATLSPVASAQSSLQAVDTGVVAQFPASLHFTVSANSAYPVTDVRLLYRIDKMNYGLVTSESWASFEPATSVDTGWTWDMRRATLPPGADITYWWKVRDASGAVVETAPTTVRFDDDRYEWQRVESADVTLNWYYGDEAFAGELLDVCDSAVDKLAVDIGARVDRRIIVYVYKSASDLRQAMVYPNEWTGGVAFTDYGIVAIGLGPGDMEWGIRALRHELTHLVVHTLTFSPYGGLPTWLDEGLAMHSEGEPEDTFVTVLRHGVQDNALLSLRTLGGPFSSDTQKAYLSYAESQSVVGFLLDRYDSQSMNRLLTMLTSGETVDSALLSSYGLDLEEIETVWKTWLKGQMGDA